MSKVEEGPDDATCLAMMCRGGHDRERGVTVLFRRYAVGCRKLIMYGRMSLPIAPEEAEEAVQEAFIRLVGGCQNIQNDHGLFAWLIRASRNAAIDQMRRQRRKFQNDLDEEELERCINENEMRGVYVGEGEQERDLLRQEVLECVRAAFRVYAEVFADRAEALRRVVFEAWSNKELAAYLDRTEGATREYLSQCRKRFRKILMEHCPDNIPRA